MQSNNKKLIYLLDRLIVVLQIYFHFIYENQIIIYRISLQQVNMNTKILRYKKGSTRLVFWVVRNLSIVKMWSIMCIYIYKIHKMDIDDEVGGSRKLFVVT